MGLASSQARMLLLTARKSDLEYRAQMISQRKMNLALQTEQLASDYSRARSNRNMEFVFQTDMSTGTQFKETLSYSSFLSENSNIIGNYLIKNANGKFLVTGANDDEVQSNMYKVAERLAKNDGSYDSFFIKDEANNITGFDTKSLIEKYASQVQVNTAFSKAEYFQEALRNGALSLVKLSNTDGEGKMETKSWSSLSFIRDNYNTVDDAQAEAEYEAQSMLLSNQDKALDLELKQIETQHKAVETEYDSVKKVIEKNIETSYKIFA